LDLRDQFFRGFIVGLSGGISTTIVGYPLYLLKVSTLRFADFSGILLYGRPPRGWLETLFAILVHWGFAAAGGILFEYLLKAISERNLYFKGWLFGVGIWFFAYMVTALYKIPGLTVTVFKNVVVNFWVSSVYGIVIAVVYSYLERKVGELEL
jgi:hypothetical protein